MNGIQTQSGIDLWLNGQREFVREFTTMLFDAASTGQYTGFQEDAQNQTMPANGTGLSLTFQEAECSLKTKGQFATPNFVATHLGIEFLNQVPTSTTVGNDTNPLWNDLIEFNARTWFEMYFTAGNEPHDAGQLQDFPQAKGFAGTGATTAAIETCAGRLVSNGPPHESALRTMKKPYRCTVETRPRIILNVLSRGAIGLSVDAAVRPTVYGFRLQVS